MREHPFHSVAKPSGHAASVLLPVCQQFGFKAAPDFLHHWREDLRILHDGVAERL